jgi:hypothetical protein
MILDRRDRLPHDIFDLQMCPDLVAEFAGNAEQPHGLGQITLRLAGPHGRVTRRPGRFAGPAVFSCGHPLVQPPRPPGDHSPLFDSTDRNQTGPNRACQNRSRPSAPITGPAGPAASHYHPAMGEPPRARR